MILPASPPRRDVIALAFLLCCCFLLVPLFLPLLCCCCCSYRRVCAGLLARRRGQPVSLPALPGRPGQRAVTGPQLSCASCLLAWCVRACVCVRVSFGFPPFLGPGAWASCRVVIACKVASLDDSWQVVLALPLSNALRLSLLTVVHAIMAGGFSPRTACIICFPARHFVLPFGPGRTR